MTSTTGAESFSLLTFQLCSWPSALQMITQCAFEEQVESSDPGTAVNRVILQVLGWYSCWCSGWDSNPHALRHGLLRPACLPFHHPSVEILDSRFSIGRQAEKPACSPIRQNQAV